MRRLALLALLALACFALYEAATWPDVARLATERPETSAFIDAARQRYGADRVAWRWVPYASISPNLKVAVVVAEDIDFFSHEGFATGEIRSALHDAWEERRLPRGASTITQQVAKNLWLSPSRNPWRKVKEAILTRQLERHLEKRRILELYLNLAELGPGIFGAEAASRHFYSRPASSRSAREAAQLAAGLPRPSSWHPGVDSRGYRSYVDSIVRRMEKAGGWIRKEL
ncbi:MAG: monofunctional biosynthetic peptidoglycan transglycosylase [Thermoanaerobaculia bacterium]